MAVREACAGSTNSTIGRLAPAGRSLCRSPRQVRRTLQRPACQPGDNTESRQVPARAAVCQYMPVVRRRLKAHARTTAVSAPVHTPLAACSAAISLQTIRNAERQTPCSPAPPDRRLARPRARAHAPSPRAPGAPPSPPSSSHDAHTPVQSRCDDTQWQAVTEALASGYFTPAGNMLAALVPAAPVQAPPFALNASLTAMLLHACICRCWPWLSPGSPPHQQRPPPRRHGRCRQMGR